MPYEEIAHLSSGARIQKIMQSVKENRIVILDGKLKKEEEVELIRTTMEEVDESFRGIELQVWEAQKKEKGFFTKLKTSIAGMLAPEMISGFTIIGPASIIKEIRKDPSKIQLITQNGKLKRRKL